MPASAGAGWYVRQTLDFLPVARAISRMTMNMACAETLSMDFSVTSADGAEFLQGLRFRNYRFVPQTEIHGLVSARMEP